MLAGEILAPQSFPGRRVGLVKAGLGFLWRWPHFAWTRVEPTASFRPHFGGWGYELRRDGAFHEFASRREAVQAAQPLVSILIRTVDRSAWLREALISCANQTYENIEVVVIEDGPEKSRAIVDEFSDRITTRYMATGERVGRAVAGNIALSEARGEWLNFLDDDDLLFADHVEVTLAAARRAGLPGAYALAWETHTRVLDREEARYEEVHHATRHAQPFDRMVLWHHNYLPIQSVIFHRRLYERHGGFDEAMDQLEDWNLWTRYTLEDDFVLVEKTTSKYRVPADAHEAADRQALLDRAYEDALERQRRMRGAFSPQEVMAMAHAHARRHRLLARVAGRFPASSRMLKRMDLIE
jgi:glycosyltransferase involved in cell wall biosynthesis